MGVIWNPRTNEERTAEIDAENHRMVIGGVAVPFARIDAECGGGKKSLFELADEIKKTTIDFPPQV